MKKTEKALQNKLKKENIQMSISPASSNSTIDETEPSFTSPTETNCLILSNPTENSFDHTHNNYSKLEPYNKLSDQFNGLNNIFLNLAPEDSSYTQYESTQVTEFPSQPLHSFEHSIPSSINIKMHPINSTIDNNDQGISSQRDCPPSSEQFLLSPALSSSHSNLNNGSSNTSSPSSPSLKISPRKQLRSYEEKMELQKRRNRISAQNHRERQKKNMSRLLLQTKEDSRRLRHLETENLSLKMHLDELQRSLQSEKQYSTHILALFSQNQNNISINQFAKGHPISGFVPASIPPPLPREMINNPQPILNEMPTTNPNSQDYNNVHSFVPLNSQTLQPLQNQSDIYSQDLWLKNLSNNIQGNYEAHLGRFINNTSVNNQKILNKSNDSFTNENNGFVQYNNILPDTFSTGFENSESTLGTLQKQLANNTYPQQLTNPKTSHSTYIFPNHNLNNVELPSLHHTPRIYSNTQENPIDPSNNLQGSPIFPFYSIKKPHVTFFSWMSALFIGFLVLQFFTSPFFPNPRFSNSLPFQSSSSRNLLVYVVNSPESFPQANIENTSLDPFYSAQDYGLTQFSDYSGIYNSSSINTEPVTSITSIFSIFSSISEYLLLIGNSFITTLSKFYLFLLDAFYAFSHSTPIHMTITLFGTSFEHLLIALINAYSFMLVSFSAIITFLSYSFTILLKLSTFTTFIPTQASNETNQFNNCTNLVKKNPQFIASSHIPDNEILEPNINNLSFNVSHESLDNTCNSIIGSNHSQNNISNNLSLSRTLATTSIPNIELGLCVIEDESQLSSFMASRTILTNNKIESNLFRTSLYPRLYPFGASLSSPYIQNFLKYPLQSFSSYFYFIQHLSFSTHKSLL